MLSIGRVVGFLTLLFIIVRHLFTHILTVVFIFRPLKYLQSLTLARPYFHLM